MNKKRVLFVSEFSQLNTGYAVYTKAVMDYLYRTGKYELAELACYCPPNAREIQGIPWKVFPNMPDHNNAQERQMYESHPTNEFGAWRFEKVCLEFRPDIVCDIRDYWMCLGKTTPIVTSDGIKNIADISIGDYVLTHYGRYRKVTNTFVRPYKGKMFRFNTSHNNHILEITPGHEVLAVKRNPKRPLPDLDFVIPKWIDSDKLSKGDLLAIPVNYGAPSDFLCNSAIARLIGYYLAEGCILYEGKKSKGKIKGIQLTLNKNEQEYVDDISKIILDNFNVQVSVKYPKGVNAVVIRAFSKEIGEFINSIAPGLSGTKKMRHDVFTSTDLIQLEILKGLFRGDGGCYETRATYCTKSKDLAYQVFHMCLKYNMLPAMGFNNNTCNNKTFTRYLFSFSDESLVNFCTIYNNTNVLLINLKENQRIQNGYAFITLKNIEEYDADENVYNFEVDEDNSYVSSIGLHNCSFIGMNPLRRFYKTIFMPTVDASPQNQEWISFYQDIDSVFTYNDWSKEVLAKEGGGLINLKGSAPPSADTNAFKFVHNKAEHKKAMGIDPDTFIIGMVARNQKRKLYPDLAESFLCLLDKLTPEERKKTYLYWHTAYPDLGWSLSDYIKNYGLTSKILFTYVCQNCKFFFSSFYRDSRCICPKCKTGSVTFPSTYAGLTRENLGMINGIFDAYVQYVTNEGFGMPMVESAFCGNPVFGTDYSAVSDVVEKLGGFKIKVKTLFHEAETGRQMAIPDGNNLAEQLLKYMRLPESMRNKKRQESYQNALEHYSSWDDTAKKWENAIDELHVDNSAWNSPPRILPKLDKIPSPEEMSDERFISYIMSTMLGETRYINKFIGLRLYRDLFWGKTNDAQLGLIYNDLSHQGHRPKYAPLDRNKVFELLSALNDKNNYWEKARFEAMQK